ncbi:hypothetical protein COCON_G00055310 [Conger conger]|uniref:Pleckstrin homology domain-containing family M member 3 n=1 Tax=Conger conger TaxID=82655 RepID=A0A9Q1DWE5_CONCO|nr:hypothetical protein COCON_G00055310 [Conger conger]
MERPNLPACLLLAGRTAGFLEALLGSVRKWTGLDLRYGDKVGSSTLVKQGQMEQREGPSGRWTSCHVELTPCELRLYSLDSSGNRQLCTAYSLSHCQGVGAPLPQDPRVLQALFFNCTRLQLRAPCQWGALDWRRCLWERVLAARPSSSSCLRAFPSAPAARRADGRAAARPAAPDPAHRPAPVHQALPGRAEGGAPAPAGRPQQLAGVHVRADGARLQAFPTEGRGPVSEPVLRYALASCLAVQRDGDAEEGAGLQVVFPGEVLRLRAASEREAQDWAEALRRAAVAAAAQRPQEGDGGDGAGEGGGPAPVAVVMRSKPSRERRQRDSQRAKRQSVTTSFLGILTRLAVEKGLTNQSFRCAGCQRPVGLSRGKAKVCRYSGWYYCHSCHDDDLFLIPARLVHNWDTTRHKVSKQAKEFLEFVYEEPLLDVARLNPGLYAHCEGLAAVLRLRQRLQSLRAYLFSCRATVAEDLRRRIFPREYLLQHIHLYSLSDLQQVIDGKLAPFLSKVIKFASSHVYSCSLCSEKGFICELCQNGQVIYPFQESATKRCEGCGAVFHTECRLRAQPCPRCVRRELHQKPSSFWKSLEHDSPTDDTFSSFQPPYQDT